MIPAIGVGCPAMAVDDDAGRRPDDATRLREVAHKLRNDLWGLKLRAAVVGDGSDEGRQLRAEIARVERRLARLVVS